MLDETRKAQAIARKKYCEEIAAKLLDRALEVMLS